MKEYLRKFTTPDALDDEARLLHNNAVHEPMPVREHIAHNLKVRRAELSTGKDWGAHYTDNVGDRYSPHIPPPGKDDYL